MAEIWYPEECVELKKKILALDLPKRGKIKASKFKSSMRQLGIWPLLEGMGIIEEGLLSKQPIKKEEWERALLLEDVLYEQFGSPFQVAFDAFEPERYSVQLIDIEDKEYMSSALEKITTCYDSPEYKDKKENIIQTFLEDIFLGGSIIYFLEKDNVPVTYNKLFSVKSNNGISLFYDSIEYGNVKAYELIDWQKDNKMDEFAYSVGFALYLTQLLGIEKLALADRELDELGDKIGCRRSYVLPHHRKKKIGTSAHPKNKYDGVYQSRLYKKRDSKHKVLNTAFAVEDEYIRTRFNDIFETMERNDFLPRGKRFNERSLYLNLAHVAVNLLNIGNKQNREIMGQYVKQVNDLRST